MKIIQAWLDDRGVEATLVPFHPQRNAPGRGVVRAGGPRSPGSGHSCRTGLARHSQARAPGASNENHIPQVKGNTLDHLLAAAGQFTFQGEVLARPGTWQRQCQRHLPGDGNRRPGPPLYPATPQPPACSSGPNWSWKTSHRERPCRPRFWRWRPPGSGRSFELPRVLLTREGRDRVGGRPTGRSGEP